MSIINAIILGAVQGATEFLPISSSGHLLIAQELLSIPKSFTYDVLLNVGTLLALLIFFRQRIYQIIRSIFKQKDYKYLSYVILASIPALAIGFIASDFIENLSAHTWLIIAMLITLGIAMIVWGKKSGNQVMDQSSSVIIGLTQTLALIPGTSRSGITILTALLRGVNIKEATEFSFMLAIPTISAAILHTLFFNDGINYITENYMTVLVGNITSFIIGAIAIKTLLNILNKNGLVAFGWYRIFLGCLIPVILLIR